MKVKLLVMLSITRSMLTSKASAMYITPPGTLRLSGSICPPLNSRASRPASSHRPTRPDLSRPYYGVLYKPYLVLSQFSPMEGKQALADVCHVPCDAYPVGRLDYDSEGLLVLSNDGNINRRLLDPGQEHKREYLVQVEGELSNEACVQLEKGVDITLRSGQRYHTRPCRATRLSEEPLLPARHPPIRFRKAIPTSWLRLILTEGKNRQVRKMTARVGFPTLRLVRWGMGSITVEGMAPGELRELPAEEAYALLGIV